MILNRFLATFLLLLSFSRESHSATLPLTRAQVDSGLEQVGAQREGDLLYVFRGRSVALLKDRVEVQEQAVLSILTSAGEAAVAILPVKFNPLLDRPEVRSLRIKRAGRSKWEDLPKPGPEALVIPQVGAGYLLISVPDPGIGDAVELLILTQGASPFSFVQGTSEIVPAGEFAEQVSFAARWPVLEAFYQVLIQGDGHLETVLADRPLLFSIVLGDEQHRYTFVARDLKGSGPEEPLPELSVSTEGTWKRLSSLLSAELEPSFILRKDLLQFARELVEGFETDLDKAKALADWVRNQVLEVPSRRKSRRIEQADLILERRLGDSWDRAGLLVALMRGAGLKGSRFALVSSGSRFPGPHLIPAAALEQPGGEFLLLSPVACDEAETGTSAWYLTATPQGEPLRELSPQSSGEELLLNCGAPEETGAREAEAGARWNNLSLRFERSAQGLQVQTTAGELEVLSRKGSRALLEYPITYDSSREEVRILRVEIRDPQGKSRRIAGSEIMEALHPGLETAAGFEGVRELIVPLGFVEPGSRVLLEYRISDLRQWRPALDLAVVLSRSFPIEELSVEVNNQDGRPLEWELDPERDYQVTVSDSSSNLKLHAQGVPPRGRGSDELLYVSSWGSWESAGTWLMQQLADSLEDDCPRPRKSVPPRIPTIASLVFEATRGLRILEPAPWLPSWLVRPACTIRRARVASPLDSALLLSRIVRDRARARVGLVFPVESSRGQVGIPALSKLASPLLEISKGGENLWYSPLGGGVTAPGCVFPRGEFLGITLFPKVQLRPVSRSCRGWHLEQRVTLEAPAPGRADIEISFDVHASRLPRVASIDTTAPQYLTEIIKQNTSAWVAGSPATGEISSSMELEAHLGGSIKEGSQTRAWFRAAPLLDLPLPESSSFDADEALHPRATLSPGVFEQVIEGTRGLYRLEGLPEPRQVTGELCKYEVTRSGPGELKQLLVIYPGKRTIDSGCLEALEEFRKDTRLEIGLYH